MEATAEIWEAGRHRFSRPFIAIIEPIPGGALATLAELDLWADGFDDLDALNDLTDSLGQLVDDLITSASSTLGPSPRRWKSTIEAALAGS